MVAVVAGMLLACWELLGAMTGDAAYDRRPGRAACMPTLDWTRCPFAMHVCYSDYCCGHVVPGGVQS